MNEMNDDIIETYRTQLELEEQMTALGKEKILGSEQEHFNQEKIVLKTQVHRLSLALENIKVDDLVIDKLDKVEIAYDCLRALVTAVRAGERGNVVFAVMTAGSFIKTRAYAHISGEKLSKGITDQLRRKAMQIGRTERKRSQVFKSLVQKQIDKHIARDNDWQLDIGRHFIFKAISALSDIFCLREIKKHGKVIYLVSYTVSAQRTLETMNLEKALQHPQYYPMIVPPRNWESVHEGCYLTKAVSKNLSLVTRERQGQRRLLQENLVSGRLKPYLNGLDVLGKTPLEINFRMIRVLEYAYENNHKLGIKKFIVDEEIEIPEQKKNDIENYFKRLKALDLKHSIESQRSQFSQDIHTAKTYSGKTFFLPHRSDFRGRVYPVSPFSHHRGDHIRSLIWSAVGKPLGSQGLQWLKYAVATAGDYDGCSKKSPDDRVAWTMSNLEFVFDCAEWWNIKPELWTDADKPFTFLNLCFELTEALMSDKPKEYHSKVFMSFDGSCSGQQHFSASLRSTEGLLVNLGPAEKVADLYQAVVDKSNEYLDRAWTQKAGLWAKWQRPILKLIEAGGLSRSIVKRNTMTFGYSSNKWGFRDQILEDLMRPIETEVRMGLRAENPYAIDNDGGYSVAGLIAELNWRSVNSVVKDTAEAMKWLRQVAGALAHEGKPLIWNSPLGFPIVHGYYEWEMQRVRGLFGGSEVPVLKLSGNYDNITQLRMLAKLRPTDVLKKNKAKSAVSPNVIHSMDASHLMSTVLYCKNEGINDFFVIHDSFATTINDTSTLYSCVREAFIDMYKDWCLYSDIQNQIRQQLNNPNTNKLKDIPEKGNLNLEDIRESAYCFS